MTLRPVDLYRDAFDARSLVGVAAGARAVAADGLRGTVTTPPSRDVDLLVEDDQALPELAALAPTAATGTIRVLSSAPRCDALLGSDPAWEDDGEATAMVLPDLRSMTRHPPVPGLVVRPVARGAATGDEVPLAATTELVSRATGRAQDRAGLVRYLESLPADVTLLAGVDRDGEIRATAGSRTFGGFAYVFFVNTDPPWQRRGIGLAMTALALLAARDRGAAAASLDASGPGARIYRRLGFVGAGRLTQHHPRG